MKKVLVCDANFCVLPIVKVIMSEKNKLSVVGSLLSDPAHKIAHNSIPINYANIDLLYNHISESNYDAIIPGCNDRSYLSLAEIANKLDYPGFDNYETVLTIHHKDKFKAFAEKHDYPIPRAVKDISNIHTLKFPILIKPTDSFSGKGIQKVENIENIEKAWESAKKFSKEGKVIAEEYVEGNLFSHSAFIKNKKIIIDFFVSEYCTVNPYQVNSSNVSVKLSQKIQNKLKKWVEQFAQDLNLVDGLVHTQFISDNENFFLIEIARRCPGDLYSELIKKSTDVDYAKLYTMPFMNQELPDIIKKEKKYFSRHTVSVEKDCIFISSGINLNYKNIQNIQLKYSGEVLKAAPFDKSGIFFIEHPSKKDMETKVKNLKEYVTLETLEIKAIND